MGSPKATYLAMETTELEFEFYLAEKLGMTVSRLRAEMSGLEWMQWTVYYGRKAQRAEMERERARK